MRGTATHEAPCGDCSPFVMICPTELEALVGQHALTADERWAVVALALLVDYESGEVSITKKDLAPYLGWHPVKTGEVLQRLADRDIVVFRFPRGHVGWVALLSYLEFVRVRPGGAPAVAKNLTARRSHNAPEVRCAGVEEVPSQRAECAEHNANIERERKAPQPLEVALRRGETAHGTALGHPVAPSASEGVGEVGALVSPAERDEARSEGFPDMSRARLSTPESIVPTPLPPGLYDLPLGAMAVCRRCRRSTVTTTDEGPLCTSCGAVGRWEFLDAPTRARPVEASA